MTIIFAVPRHEYASYRDLYTLIDLSGFQKCFIDEIDPQSENAYVITILNGEVPEAGYPDARARIALWDLEYHLEGLPKLENIEVWAADAFYARQINARYIPMGSHYNLRQTQHSMNTERYDAAFLGYMIPRRERIYVELKQAGMRLPTPHAWGEERDRILISSTAYLHIHQHEHIRTIAPLRTVVAAAYRLPYITETCEDYGVFSDCALPLDYADFVESTVAWTCGEVLAFEKALSENADRLHEKLCVEMPFRKSVENAL